ncbi:MAG: KH domain-containing protein [Methanomicrobia archaeon]|nr:KH domain-containing protein [Methanomicrobia archaeon]
MNYEKIIHTLVDPFLDNPDALLIRQMPSESERDIVILVVANSEDTARLIGRKGIIADALREVISIAGKTENKHIHLKFESFDKSEKEEE